MQQVNYVDPITLAVVRGTLVSTVLQMRQILEQERREPATFSLSKRVYVAVTHDKKRESERLQEWFGKHYGNPARALEVSVIGGEQECVEGLAEVVSEGIDLLMLNPVFDPI